MLGELCLIDNLLRLRQALIIVFQNVAVYSLSNLIAIISTSTSLDKRDRLKKFTISFCMSLLVKQPSTAGSNSWWMCSIFYWVKFFHLFGVHWSLKCILFWNELFNRCSSKQANLNCIEIYLRWNRSIRSYKSRGTFKSPLVLLHLRFWVFIRLSDEWRRRDG